MSRINTNIPAIQAIHRLTRNNADLGVRLERLSTGLRINRGADDPAGLISSERLRSEIRSIGQAIENSNRASNVIATAEGALNEVSAMLLDLQNLVVAAANEGGVTEEELKANQLQIDSILASIDRIADTTTFAGRRLLDGSNAYNLSAVPTAALADVSVFAARVPQGSYREVIVQVTQSAQTARLAFVGTTVGASSRTSATTVEVRGPGGGELLTFASGTTLAEVRTAINSVTVLTGVSAVLSTPAAGLVRSALILQSTSYGSDAFVSVAPIGGSFIAAGNSGATLRDTGADAGVLVDGQRAAVAGLLADVRTDGFDAQLELNPTFAQRLSSATFTITGGGTLFQLTPQINPKGQVNVALNSIATSQLGSLVVGRLYTLRSGQANDLAGGNFATAQAILAEAIDQVSSYRGRLGNLQRNQIDPNINSQRVALENVTASESVIRDADIATEVSALTRAQVLVQSTQATLQLANSLPTMALSLLG